VFHVVATHAANRKQERQSSAGVFASDYGRLPTFFYRDEASMGSITSAGYRVLLVVLVSSALISCASTSVSSPDSNQYHTQISYLPEAVSASLQQAKVGQSVSLEQSPWGPAVSVELVARYFSAAGRECVSALVHTTQPAKAVVLCQYEPQRWGVTRALTHTIQ
jgi:hypothetical protein